MNLFRTKSIEEIQRSADVEQHKLKRVLTAKDIVALGIGAVIGAGIFATIGDAAATAGPALMLSFALLGLVCAFAGLCYAELTAMIPVSGSAYTYAFATMGEFIAWIIGWDLILEYAIGNVAVAIAWSGYFQSILGYFGLHLPDFIAYSIGDVHERIAHYSSPDNADPIKLAEYQTILANAPAPFGKPLLINLPAVAIVLLITWLLVRGISESTRVNNIMVVLKLAVLALFIGVGAFYVDPENWKPFAPNGWTGIHQGAAAVFFAYIGFDAVSTAAEETKNPKRDMPIGILVSLGICTIIYMIVGAVATGLVPYKQLADGADPLARALEGANLPAVQLIVSLGAVISMSAVLLVFQMGQPRIFFAMSRDGLLPSAFAKVHPKYRTPHVTTILTGLVVAVGAAVMDDNATYDLTSIGTLFAFAIVCIGVLILRVKKPDAPRPFRVPFVWLIAPLGAGLCVYTMWGLDRHAWERFGIWLAIGVAIYFFRVFTVRRVT